MQTFLPYADFKKTAKSLDMKRLGKQRVEAMQILMVLAGINKGKGWINHPAVKMWQGHELALAEYAYCICDEWVGLGYKDTCREKIKQIIIKYYPNKDVKFPDWLGNENFHQAHQSNLIRKKPEHYLKFFNVKNDLPYIWPTENKSCQI